MKRIALMTGAAALLLAMATTIAQQPPAPAPAAPAPQGAQAPPQGPQPYFVGNRLGMPINPAADGSFQPMSSNV